jgi:RNA-binding protein 23/39
MVILSLLLAVYGVQESERGIRTLFVRNMPLKAAEKDIEVFFGNLGCKVREIQLIKDNKTKKSKGSASLPSIYLS